MSYRNRFSWLIVLLAFTGVAGFAGFAGFAAWAAEPITTLRKAPIDKTARAPRMSPVLNTDLRTVRNYPEQPPLIPHKIDGYQIDRNANKCLTCHSRTAIGDSQAPMISVTHFMDREGQVLASVSGRRYFCNQCHVIQQQRRAAVGNTFTDIEKVLKKRSPDKPKK